MEIIIRPMGPGDNQEMAAVIRTVMPEFGCVGPGYSIEDPEMDDLYATYSLPRSGYFVAEVSGADAGFVRGPERAKPTPGTEPENFILAGAGYAPLAGADPGVCELRKMYALPIARGHGLGRRLLERCITEATAAGFSTMYLESVTAMNAAAKLYLAYGFRYLDAPLGHTGHGSCEVYMARPL